MPKVSHMRVFKQKLGFKANDRWAKSIFGQISKIRQFWTHVTNFSGIHRVPKKWFSSFLHKFKYLCQM